MRSLKLVISAGVLAGAMAAGTLPAAAAEQFPDKPIRLVVPWVPGGFTDMLARLVAEKMTRSLGQTVLVENRPGANGMIGTDSVAKAAPDGHTILMATADTHAINPFIYSKVPYDAVKDFAPIGMVVSAPLVLSTYTQSPEKSFAELTANAKKSPGRYKYASWGEGSTGHLAMELFNSPAGISMIHVPYKGTGGAITDVMAGRVDLILVTLLTGDPFFKSNRLRGLAVTSPQRLPLLPDLPTVAESGYPGYDVALWYALVAPGATPAPVVEKLNAALRDVLKDPEFQAKMLGSGVDILAGSPADAARYIARERVKWEGADRSANVKLDR